MHIAVLYIASYLLGSVPTAYLIGRLAKGVDIRSYGSGNVGSANVFEHLGKKWLIPLSVSEFVLKGVGPVWAGIYLLDWDRSSPWVIGAPLLALVGNNWSPWLRFQGGRGIIVAGGNLLLLSPPLLAICAAIGIGGWVVTKSSGPWVLISIALLPLWAYLIHDNWAIFWHSVALLGIIVLKRLSSNWSPLPPDLSTKRVLVNRLLRDRDVNDRSDWVNRMPARPDNTNRV